MKNKGLVYIFTGNGKGKTSAALGILTRALAHGWRVGWVSWYKEARWSISEHKLGGILLPGAKKRLQFFPMGEGFYIRAPEKKAPVHKAVVTDHATKQAHERSAKAALDKAVHLLPSVDVLVLDEVCNAVADGLVSEESVLKLLESRDQTHIILTGRNASKGLIECADLVSEVQKVKHPYDAGRMAVPGLDF